MPAPHTVGLVVGNPKAQSRTLALGRQVAAAAADAAGLGDAPTLTVDLAELGSQLFDWSSPGAQEAVDGIRSCALVVVASPTYKASYTGLLKSFLDWFGNTSLEGVTVIPVMTGAGAHHALAVELHLRPILVELGATLPCRGLYVTEAELPRADQVIADWLRAAAPVLRASLASLSLPGPGHAVLTQKGPMPPPDQPRLAPVPFAEWDDETRTTLLQFLRRPERYLSGEPAASPMPIVLEMFAQHLPLSASWLPFTEMLASDASLLRAEHRELLILRVAWRTHSGYEWSQHSRMAADAGLTEQQIEAVTEGPAAAVWTPLERALLRAVDEVIDEHVVGDETWAALAAHFEPAEIFELLFLIGGYLCLAGVLNSIGLQGVLPSAAGGAAGG
jgi:4-carboxymuconolactone decarboxylase